MTLQKPYKGASKPSRLRAEMSEDIASLKRSAEANARLQDLYTSEFRQRLKAGDVTFTEMLVGLSPEVPDEWVSIWNDEVGASVIERLSMHGDKRNAHLGESPIRRLLRAQGISVSMYIADSVTRDQDRFYTAAQGIEGARNQALAFLLSMGGVSDEHLSVWASQCDLLETITPVLAGVPHESVPRYIGLDDAVIRSLLSGVVAE
jgi:hypothetical protein